MANEVPFPAPHPPIPGLASEWRVERGTASPRDLLRRLAGTALRTGRLGATGLAFALPSCNATGTALVEVAPTINASYEGERMGILPGDLLEVRFTEREAWNHETLVRPDGTASFLHLGDVQVGGVGVEELGAYLTEAYAATIRQFELTVFVKETGGRAVAVTGAVGEPGIYELPQGRRTLLEALAGAGGADEADANLKDVHLVRWLPSERRQLVWRIDARPEHWDRADPVLLQPYDVVYVPLKTIVHVNVWVDQYIRQMLPFPYLIPYQ